MSFSKTITPTEITQAASSGARSRGRGSVIPIKCLPTLVNRPRLATNTAEKKISSRILENSAGCIEKPGKRIQIFAPFCSDSEAGNSAGTAKKIRPASP